MGRDLILSTNDFANDENGFFEWYRGLLKLCGSFGQSHFSEKHFVLDACLTPKRKLRQAMLQVDDKMHAYAESMLNRRKIEAYLLNIESDLSVLGRIYDVILKQPGRPEALPAYECEIQERENIRKLAFRPEQILGVYQEDEWDECRTHLLSDLDTLLVFKETERDSIKRSLVQAEKTISDCKDDLEWYRKELEKLEKDARESKLTPEQEEELYQRLRMQRYIETKQMEEHTGWVAQDYWESISRLPKESAEALLAFAAENKRRLQTDGPPTKFHYLEETQQRIAQLTSPEAHKALTGPCYLKANPRVVVAFAIPSQQYMPRTNADAIYAPDGLNRLSVPLVSCGLSREDAWRLFMANCAANQVDFLLVIDPDLLVPCDTLSVLYGHMSDGTDIARAVVSGDAKNPFACSLYRVKPFLGGASYESHPSVPVSGIDCLHIARMNGMVQGPKKYVLDGAIKKEALGFYAAAAELLQGVRIAA